MYVSSCVSIRHALWFWETILLHTNKIAHVKSWAPKTSECNSDLENALIIVK